MRCGAVVRFLGVPFFRPAQACYAFVAMAIDLDNLQSDLVTLQRLGTEDLDRLTEDFREEGLYSDAGLRKPPSKRDLREDMEEGELFIFDRLPEDSHRSVGYAGIVGYSGPPYVSVHYHQEDSPDLDMAREAFLLLAHVFFQRTEEEQLWTYHPKPVPDEIQDLLLEGGFDAWDTHVPGIDNETTAAFIMFRHTYLAYYSDEAEEDHEAFEDY